MFIEKDLKVIMQVDPFENISDSKGKIRDRILDLIKELIADFKSDFQKSMYARHISRKEYLLYKYYRYLDLLIVLLIDINQIFKFSYKYLG